MGDALGPDRTDASAATAERLGPWFPALVAGLEAGVVLVDPRGEPFYASARARELLGIPPRGEGALDALRELLPPEVRTAETAGPGHELRVPGPGRLRTLRLRSIRAEGSAGRLVLVENVTRQAALQASLTLASRIRTLAALRSEVHDLKAPLNALALNLELLRKSILEEEDKVPEARERQTEIAELLQKEIARLGRSLDAFLQRTSLGPTAAVQRRRLQVAGLVREVARLARPRARTAGVRLQTLLPDSAAHALVDGDRLKQALLNLVLNALEAQPDGGEIRLRLEVDEPWVTVLVEDDGPGIPESLQGRVFEMNFTTKEEGTGIGLSVARSLVEAQGGQLQIESTAELGTTVRLLLPRDD